MHPPLIERISMGVVMVCLMATAIMVGTLGIRAIDSGAKDGFIIVDCTGGILAAGYTNHGGDLTTFTAAAPPTPDQWEILNAVPEEGRHIVIVPCIENNNGGAFGSPQIAQVNQEEAQAARFPEDGGTRVSYSF